MSDAEYLFLVLAAFYFAECAFWLRPGMWIFSRQFFGLPWRCVDARWAVLQNQDGGVLLCNLLPLGQASVCQQWPLSLSPRGVYGYVSQVLSRADRPRQSERFILYDDITLVETHGTKLFLNGVQFANLSSSAFARYLARLVRELKKLSPEDRAPIISKTLTEHLDVNKVQARIALFRQLTANLQITCCLLFFLVFVLPPVLVSVQSSFPVFALLGPYFALVLLGIVQFRNAHLFLYPDETAERWKSILTMLVSPADAIHARDKLGRFLLIRFSPVAIANAVFNPLDFQRFAGNVWRDLEYPMLPVCPAPDVGPQETEAWFRIDFKLQLRHLLQSANIDLDELLLPPKPEDGASRSYCPRCLGQYVLESGACEDCGGCPLQRWQPTPTHGEKRN